MLSAGFERSFVVHTYVQSAVRCFGLLRTLGSPYTYAMLAALVVPKLVSGILGVMYKLAGKQIQFSYYIDAMKTNRIN